MKPDTIVILYDGYPIVCCEYRTDTLLSRLLDDYSSLYAIDRKKLSYSIVKTIPTPKL